MNIQTVWPKMAPVFIGPHIMKRIFVVLLNIFMHYYTSLHRQTGIAKQRKINKRKGVRVRAAAPHLRQTGPAFINSSLF